VTYSEVRSCRWRTLSTDEGNLEQDSRDPGSLANRKSQDNAAGRASASDQACRRQTSRCEQDRRSLVTVGQILEDLALLLQVRILRYTNSCINIKDACDTQLHTHATYTHTTKNTYASIVKVLAEKTYDSFNHFKSFIHTHCLAGSLPPLRFVLPALHSRSEMRIGLLI
jgi:hypothetical protein